MGEDVRQRSPETELEPGTTASRTNGVFRPQVLSAPSNAHKAPSWMHIHSR